MVSDEDIDAEMEKLLGLYEDLYTLKESRVNKRMTYRYGRKRNAMPYRFGKRASDRSYDEFLNNLRSSGSKDRRMPYRYGK